MSDKTFRRRRVIGATVILSLVVLVLTGFAIARAPVAELVFDIGPVPLSTDTEHHAQPAPRAVALPVDGWLRGFKIDIVDERGNPLPRQLLHHVNLIAPEKRELFSPIMLRLGAAGPETAPVKLPGVLGYRFHRGDSLLVTAMLHNPTTHDVGPALVRVRLFYMPLRAWLRPASIYPFYMDVMPPAGKHAYDLPPGRSERSWEGRPAVAGRIVGVGGHMHRYGVVLRFEDVTAARVLWEASPGTDTHGMVTHMPTKYFVPFGIPIRPDHTYRLTAVYDNPTDSVVPDGGMGALGGALLLEGAEWPPVVAADSTYRHDLRVTYGSHAGHAEADHRHSTTSSP